MGTRRKLGIKGVVRRKTSYGLCNGSKIQIADNSGAKIAQIINVDHYKGRLRRLPKATVGSVCTVTIKKGKPEM